MAYKIVAIFVILVSWSTLLNAQGCQGGQDVPIDDEIKEQAHRRISQSFSDDNIKCAKRVTGFGGSITTCVEVVIPAPNGGCTSCTVKWGNGRGSASSSVCSTNGAGIVNGSGRSGITIGGSGSNGLTIGGPGNSGVQNAMHNMRNRFSKVFGPGFPFNK